MCFHPSDSNFLAAYRLSRPPCPEALERSTTLDPEDPFTIPLDQPGAQLFHLIYSQSFRPMNGMQDALLCCSTRTTQRYGTGHKQGYLKPAHSAWSLVREGVFEVKVTLE